jgi:hypothetical protein
MERYVERTSSMINIGEAARRAKVSGQRFRRAVKKLRIPVARSGWTVLIEARAVARVLKAFKTKRIAQGRPKKRAH